MPKRLNLSVPVAPTRPSPPVVDITSEGGSTVPASDGVVVGASEQGMTALPSADRVVGSGETADGVPFLLAVTGPGSKPRTAQKITPDSASFREIGAASPSPITSALRQDPNTALRGTRGLSTYRQMWRENGAVRRAIRRIQTPIESARWTVIPGEDSTAAKKQAEFVAENLFEGLDVTWAQTLSDILLMLRYGYSMLNKVYIKDVKAGTGGASIKLAKLAPRHPLDVERVVYDKFGSPEFVSFFPAAAYETRNDGNPSPVGNAGSKNIEIKMANLVVFTLEGEAGDIQGTSVLRSAYGHWVMMNALMKIDAVQKERHAVGVPVITLPPGATDAELSLAEEIGRNLRANERSHVVLPDPNWNLEWAKIEGSVVNPLESAEWHAKQIELNVLWEDTDNGYDLFMKSTRYIADRIADTLNKWVVKELVDYNWANVKKYPRITPRWIGEFEDMRTRSFAVRNLIGAGAITPDEPLEAAFRKELDLPMADLTTRRMVASPQNPNDPNGEAPEGGPTPAPGAKQRGQQAGAARQAAPPSGKQQSNAGTDRSGGK